MSAEIIIQRDNLESEPVRQMVADHFKAMKCGSPEGSCHVLDIENLQKDDVTFWVVKIADDIAGCGALKELDREHGEIKSMRTLKTFLRRGIGANMLQFIIDEAKRRGYQRLSLETGADDGFLAARGLYRKFGFVECEPFGGYQNDPNCTYMTKILN